MKGLAGAEDMRAQIKIQELTAERLEQERLYSFAMQHWPARGSAAPREALGRNLDLFLRAHGAPGAESVAALLAAAG